MDYHDAWMKSPIWAQFLFSRFLSTMASIQYGQRFSILDWPHSPKKDRPDSIPCCYDHHTWVVIDLSRIYIPQWQLGMVPFTWHNCWLTHSSFSYDCRSELVWLGCWKPAALRVVVDSRCNLRPAWQLIYQVSSLPSVVFSNQYSLEQSRFVGPYVQSVHMFIVLQRME